MCHGRRFTVVLLSATNYEFSPKTMSTETKLSTREGLVENLDSEPLFDYLFQHGVLDDDTVTTIRGETTQANKNVALLKHLDSHGNFAIGLFINALRQSGQLQLASSLDVTNQIKPIYGTGYWQKPRHKGQIVIEVQVLAVKTVLQKSKDDHDGPNNGEHDAMDHDRSMDRWISMEDVRNAMETGPWALSPRSRAYYKSFENMTILEQPERTPSPRVHKIQQFAYDDEEDMNKKSCFCLCLPKLFSNKKKDKGPTKDLRSSPNCKLQRNGKSSRYHETPSRTPSRGSKQGSPTKQLFPGANEVLVGEISGQYSGRTEQIIFERQTMSNDNDKRVAIKNSINQQNKEENHNLPTVNNDKRLDHVDGNLSGTISPDCVSEMTRQTEAIDGIEEWISSVDILKETSRRFYSLFDNVDDQPHIELLKYFEQERGLLILETHSNDGLVIVNICMTKGQLEKLRKDFENGKLQSDLEASIITREVLEAVGVKGVQLDVRIEEDQFLVIDKELS